MVTLHRKKIHGVYTWAIGRILFYSLNNMVINRMTKYICRQMSQLVMRFIYHYYCKLLFISGCWCAYTSLREKFVHCTYISIPIYYYIVPISQYYKRVFLTNLFLKNHGILSRFTYLLKLPLYYLMKIENNNIICSTWLYLCSCVVYTYTRLYLCTCS